MVCRMPKTKYPAPLTPRKSIDPYNHFGVRRGESPRLGVRSWPAAPPPPPPLEVDPELHKEKTGWYPERLVGYRAVKKGLVSCMTCCGWVASALEKEGVGGPATVERRGAAHLAAVAWNGLQHR